jgi:chromate transporter
MSVAPRELFLAFSALALQSFGGVLPIAQRVLCERRRWLTPEQYLEVFALCQVLPGPNVCNLALVVGDRFSGWRGALAALAGLIAAPLAVVLALAALCAQAGALESTGGAMRGMGAAAAGLIVGSALRLLPSLRANPLRPLACAAFGAAAFASVALLHWPVLWVLPSVGLAACLYAWRRTEVP